ncbi:MAG TPA: PadR family transcriptional regulator, partial [Gammaproteobacteria bacterium]|nr:PadR family transcriptional regulator [Gammaproteobacteria bacterium]
MKVTYSTVLVLEALARGYHYGFDIIDATHLPSGTVYPILRRFENEGLVTSEWEAHDVATRDQRPPRRYYALTADGKQLL